MARRWCLCGLHVMTVSRNSGRRMRRPYTRGIIGADPSRPRNRRVGPGGWRGAFDRTRHATFSLHLWPSGQGPAKGRVGFWSVYAVFGADNGGNDGKQSQFRGGWALGATLFLRQRSGYLWREWLDMGVPKGPIKEAIPKSSGLEAAAHGPGIPLDLATWN